MARLGGDGHDPHAVVPHLLGLGSEVVPLIDVHAAALRPRADALSLSLRDRSCVALARARGIPDMTADRAWRSLAVGVAAR